MKKGICILSLLTLILISCKENHTKENGTEKTNKAVVLIEKVNSKKEISSESKTLIDTTKIRKFAESILENKTYPSDNDETFACIKKMYTKNQSDLEFYFKVFRVIIKKSDGALAEVMGLEIMNFLKFNPDFFIDKYSEFEPNEEKSIIGYLAYEFYFSEPEHNAEIDSFFQEVKSNFKSSTEPKRKYLNLIKELTKIEVQKNIDE